MKEHGGEPETPQGGARKKSRPTPWRVPKPRSPASENVTWLPPGERRRIQGVHIAGGLYVGESDYHGDRAPLAVDPGLPTRMPGHAELERDLVPGTRYLGMTPRERRRYLWWLAGNRTEPEIPPGYVLAYLETLEHRLLIDLAAVPGEEIEANRTEARALTDELERLVELHDARRRISEAARKLAEAARIVHAFDGTTWHAAHPAPGRTPVDLARAIGQRLARGEEIPAGELLVWWKSQPGTRDRRGRAPATSLRADRGARAEPQTRGGGNGRAVGDGGVRADPPGVRDRSGALARALQRPEAGQWRRGSRAGAGGAGRSGLGRSDRAAGTARGMDTTGRIRGRCAGAEPLERGAREGRRRQHGGERGPEAPAGRRGRAGPGRDPIRGDRERRSAGAPAGHLRNEGGDEQMNAVEYVSVVDFRADGKRRGLLDPPTVNGRIVLARRAPARQPAARVEPTGAVASARPRGETRRDGRSRMAAAAREATAPAPPAPQREEPGRPERNQEPRTLQGRLRRLRRTLGGAR